MFYINAFTLGACKDTRHGVTLDATIRNIEPPDKKYWSTYALKRLATFSELFSWTWDRTFILTTLSIKTAHNNPSCTFEIKLHLFGRVETFKSPFIRCLVGFYVPRVMPLTIGYIWSCPVVVTVLFSVHRPFYVWHFLKRFRPTVYG